jgi:UDP-3-O-[3-hydroxymyristoyl] N-acetylglucosamine deacetylase
VLEQQILKILTRAMGVGVHSGQSAPVIVRLTQADSGTVFRRVDLPNPVDMAMLALALTSTLMASIISNIGVKVHAAFCTLAVSANPAWVEGQS